MENIKNSNFIESAVKALKKSAVELEKFQVDVALGKAEVKESYEEINFFLIQSTQRNISYQND